MMIYDRIKVVVDREEYLECGVSKGMVGRICSPEIRDNMFLVGFIDDEMKIDDIIIPIRISDMEFYERGFGTVKNILEEMPGGDGRWWCIVEDGFIKNLKGDKKNKIPYDYDS